MKLNPDSLEAQLLHLPPRERARLVELLLARLDATDSDVVTVGEQHEVDAAWAAEADRRYAELAGGDVAGVPAAEVYAELEADLRGERESR
jgi:putative addiction module component (TIGR02574 family)